jgi:hypothetical protein
MKYVSGLLIDEVFQTEFGRGIIVSQETLRKKLADKSISTDVIFDPGFAAVTDYAKYTRNLL